MQKKKLKKFIAAAAVAAFGFIACGAGLTMKTAADNADYQNWLEKGEQAVREMNAKEAIEDYEEALKIKPTEIKAFEGLIEAFRIIRNDEDCNEEQIAFTTEESSVLTDYLSKNVEKTLLENNKNDYIKLTYDIGILYWYYYDYGRNEAGDINSNETTRMTAAIPWFKVVRENGDESNTEYNKVLAEAYYNIGEFKKNITSAQSEGKDKELYAQYYKSLKELVELVREDDTEIVMLEVYRISLTSIETYARYFKNHAGVELNDVLAFYEELEEYIVAFEASPNNEELLSSIAAHLEQAEIAIENAYRE